MSNEIAQQTVANVPPKIFANCLAEAVTPSVEQQERAISMATNRNFTNFRAVYDDLTDEVVRARSQFVPDHLDNWFALIDETPGVREIVQKIESSVSLEQYQFINRLKPSRGVLPPPPPIGRSMGPLEWPADRERRLGMKLNVFREIARRKLSIADFEEAFIKIDVAEEVGGVGRPAVDHVFSPMARELRRRLEAELLEREDLTVPAADRTVTLDHNSAAYAEAIDALQRLEEVLCGANDFAEPEEKEERIAEVSAAHRVLRAIRVRVEPVVALLRPVVDQFGKKLKDTVIGIAANKAVAALAGLLGQVFRSLMGL